MTPMLLAFLFLLLASVLSACAGIVLATGRGTTGGYRALGAFSLAAACFLTSICFGVAYVHRCSP